MAYYDLLDEILHAKPSPLVKPSDDEVEHMRSNYQVNEPQARAICAATNNEGFTLIQGYDDSHFAGLNNVILTYVYAHRPPGTGIYV